MSSGLTNSASRYGGLAMLFHWGMAVALVGLTGLGLYMVALPDAGFDRTKITLILAHKAIGIGALVAVVLRLAWRLLNPLPRLASGLAPWQQFAARFVHLALYALMVALPLSGWLMSSAGGYPVPFFGVDLPALVPLNEHAFRLWIDIHRWLADALVLLVALHVGAALRHHVGLRDDTLRKILPGG